MPVQAVPMARAWLNSPAVGLARLAGAGGAPSAAYLSARPPADGPAVQTLVRIEVGDAVRDVRTQLRALGRPMQHAALHKAAVQAVHVQLEARQSGSPAGGGAEEPFLFCRTSSPYTDAAAVEVWCANTRAGRAQRDQLLLAKALPLQVSGVAVRAGVKAHHAVTGGGASCRVTLANLPPNLAVRGCLSAVLRSAGYAASEFEVEAEMLALDGDAPPHSSVPLSFGSCLARVVAWVGGTAAEEGLCRLPLEFRAGEFTVRLHVEPLWHVPEAGAVPAGGAALGGPTRGGEGAELGAAAAARTAPAQAVPPAAAAAHTPAGASPLARVPSPPQAAAPSNSAGVGVSGQRGHAAQAAGPRRSQNAPAARVQQGSYRAPEPPASARGPSAAGAAPTPMRPPPPAAASPWASPPAVRPPPPGLRAAIPSAADPVLSSAASPPPSMLASALQPAATQARGRAARRRAAAAKRRLDTSPSRSDPMPVDSEPEDTVMAEGSAGGGHGARMGCDTAPRGASAGAGAASQRARRGQAHAYPPPPPLPPPPPMPPCPPLVPPFSLPSAHAFDPAAASGSGVRVAAAGGAPTARPPAVASDAYGAAALPLEEYVRRDPGLADLQAKIRNNAYLDWFASQSAGDADSLRALAAAARRRLDADGAGLAPIPAALHDLLLAERDDASLVASAEGRVLVVEQLLLAFGEVFVRDACLAPSSHADVPRHLRELALAAADALQAEYDAQFSAWRHAGHRPRTRSAGRLGAVAASHRRERPAPPSAPPSRPVSPASRSLSARRPSAGGAAAAAALAGR